MKKLILFLSFLLTSCSITYHPPIDPMIDMVLTPVIALQDGTGNIHGSGTIISSKKEHDHYVNIVMTNWHVIDGFRNYQEEIHLRTFGYDEFGYRDNAKSNIFPVEVLYESELVDCAVLRFYTGIKLCSIKILPSDIQIKLFDDVIIVGCQLGQEPSATFGKVVDPIYVWFDGFVSLKVTAQIIFGNSGGACYLSEYGEIYYVGIPSRIATYPGGAVPHMAFVSPISEILKQMEKDGFILDV